MKPRLLLIAYCCSPEGGSEPAVGWTLAKLAAERFDVTVLVEEHKFGPVIRRWLEEHGPLDGVTFEFVPEKWWAHSMWACGLGYVSYRWWHDRALSCAESLHQQTPFDAVQLATIIGFREPGRWTKLGIPFIWGPVGGTHNYVPAFYREAGPVNAAMEWLRGRLNDWQRKRSSRVRSSLEQAHTVVAATNQIARDLGEVVDRPMPVVSEITLADSTDAPVARNELADGFHLLWSGLHEPRKCLSLLIRALAEVPQDVPVKVRVAGDGPMRARWQRLAEKLEVADRIEWLGWIPHDEAVEQFRWADAFVFTSVRDTTGTVLLESLSAGVPVITLDHQGAGDVVTETSGIKVPVSSVDETASALARAITTLATDSVTRRVLADGATERANDYRFDAKRSQWNDVWSSAVPALNDIRESPAASVKECV